MHTSDTAKMLEEMFKRNSEIKPEIAFNNLVHVIGDELLKKNEIQDQRELASNMVMHTIVMSVHTKMLAQITNTSEESMQANMFASAFSMLIHMTGKNDLETLDSILQKIKDMK